MKEKISEKYEAFKVRNAAYYKKAFSKMEQKNGCTFNWAACLLSTSWMIYRRMWFSLMAYTLVSIALSPVVSGIWSADGLPGSLLRLISSLLVAAIMGFIGNSLYYMELQWKIKNGYHLKRDFSPTSVRCAVFVPIIGGIVIGTIETAAHVYTTAFPKGSSFGLSVAGSAIMICIYAVICFWEHRKYRTVVIKTDKDSIKQYLDKKGSDNLTPVIWGAVYFFVLFFLMAIVAIAGMRFVGKKITNQLNTIADDIDKNGGKTSQIPGKSDGAADGITVQLDSIANDIDQMNDAQIAPVSQDTGGIDDASNNISEESPDSH